MKLVLVLLFVTSLACDHNSDCPRLHTCQAGSCVHKGLFPLDAWEIVGSVLILLCLACGIAAGVGGGMLLFPIILILFDFGPHEGIPIITTITVVAAFVAYLGRCRQRNVGGRESVINYRVAALCLPCNYLGSVYGVRLNQASPQWLLVLLIVLLLAYVMWKTLQL